MFTEDTGIKLSTGGELTPNDKCPQTNLRIHKGRMLRLELGSHGANFSPLAALNLREAEVSHPRPVGEL